MKNNKFNIPKLINAETLLKQDNIQQKWLVNGFFPVGVTIISSPPKMGKTFFALQVAASLASESETIFENLPISQVNCLYISLDENLAEIQSRLALIKNKFNLANIDRLLLLDSFPRLDNGGLNQLEFIIRAHEIRFVVIDLFVNLVPESYHFGNYSKDYNLITGLKKIAYKYSLAIALVHHNTKTKQKNDQNNISGSAGIQAACDGWILLTYEPETEVYYVHTKSNHTAEKFFPASFSESGLWLVSTVKRRNRVVLDGDSDYENVKEDVVDDKEAFENPLPDKLTDDEIEEMWKQADQVDSQSYTEAQDTLSEQPESPPTFVNGGDICTDIYTLTSKTENEDRNTNGLIANTSNGQVREVVEPQNVKEQDLGERRNEEGDYKESDDFKENRIYGYIPIVQIKENQMISHYMSPSTCFYTRVLKSGDEYFELDNYCLVEKAKQEGEELVYCEIIESEISNDLYPSILKAGSRIRSAGGEITYPERIKIVNQLARLIRSSNKEYIEYEHGGKRRYRFGEDRGKDIRTILAESLNLVPKTVTAILRHGRYLNDETLDQCMAKGWNKNKFEALQTDKGLKIEELKSQGMPEETITEEISKFVLEYFEQVNMLDTTETETQQENDSSDKQALLATVLQTLRSLRGNHKEESSDMPEEIEQLEEVSDNESNDDSNIYNDLINEIFELSEEENAEEKQETVSGIEHTKNKLHNVAGTLYKLSSSPTQELAELREQIRGIISHLELILQESEDAESTQ